MSLADDLADARVKTVRPCRTALWLEGIEQRDVNAFNDYLSDGGAVSELFVLAKNNGYEGGLTTFRAHCRGRCGCVNGAAQ
ncbi:hypothetical protein QNA24_29670 [Rhodococcus qingshengii]|uniref:hypothetical protein n=1 Tax=Rhodococcus qingshengii TaxID=334542 RepID=UPI0024BAF134|nr:hypothetical protein [Rhodococcus qingshengii]MDJ0490553.1 hypothetical protein [Rhodococcus qingshengii]